MKEQTGGRNRIPATTGGGLVGGSDWRINWEMKSCKTCRYSGWDVKLPCGYCCEFSEWKQEVAK